MDDAKGKYRRLKLRWRRKMRKQKRQVEDITLQADDSIDKLVFKRFDRLVNVRRFVLTWIFLLLFIGFGSVWQVRGLDKFYLTSTPSNGGVYREGLLGNFTTANPIFATGTADVAVSKLVFSGLFKISPNKTLEPDLATDYEIDEKGLTYTVNLKQNVVWHDGEPFNSEDVVFTYELIKNPNVKSPLGSSWDDVKVTADGDYKVIFSLPSSLGSFKYSLTNGIVPEHILSGVDPADLRSAHFNSINPVGTGPFTYKNVKVIGSNAESRTEKITLEANEEYYNNGPLIDGAVIRTYKNEEQMQAAFDDREILSMVGLQTYSSDGQDDVEVYSTPLSNAVMLFLNNSSNVLNDKNIRQALAHASNTEELIKRIEYQLIEVNSPFLKSHFAYDEEKTQFGHDKAAAVKLLDDSGWKLANDGFRYKDGKKLTLKLVSQSLTEYATIIQGLQQQWGELGVSVDAILQPERDIQAGAIARHEYDVLLYGIALGLDPDVFAFWHSSQADPRLRSRLNLSEFKNEKADTSLEAGRTRLDNDLRKVKYQEFLDEWKKDVPAIALYQPRFLYVTRDSLEGYNSGQFSDPSDRFYSINEWQVRREKKVM